MVKPTLKPDAEKEKKEDDLKDDKLKEWGILPAAVVIDETEKEKDKKDAEAAITELENLDTEVDTAPRPLIVKFCVCFAVVTIVLIVTCTIGSFLYFNHANKEGHKWKGWCSVKYDGDQKDHDSREKGHRGAHHDRGHSGSSSEEERPNWLYPRPTGPPDGRKTCTQQSEVDLDEQYERIERPEDDESERLTILHDYKANISAYRLWKSEICYVTWIEQDILMNPLEFWTNMQDPEYLNQYFNELVLTYRAVLPAIPTPLNEQENGKYGEYLDGPKDFLCEGADTYWIEKIPEDEIEEFLQLVEQIIQQLMQLAASDDQQQGHGGYGGEEMPEWPWNDGEPLEGDDDDMPMHGGRDWSPMEGFPYGYRPHDGFPGMPHHGGHHGEHHGGLGRGHGSRKRREIGDHNLKQKITQKAQECADKLKNTKDHRGNFKMSEIGKDALLVKNVHHPCLWENEDEIKGMLGL